MEINEITGLIIKKAFKIHSNLGPGLLESSYEECLTYELQSTGLKVERQKPLPLIYETIRLEVGYRLDLLVENKVVIEVKSIEALHPIHIAQVLTYLKLSGCNIGLIINFNSVSLKDGIKRLIR